MQLIDQLMKQIYSLKQSTQWILDGKLILANFKSIILNMDKDKLVKVKILFLLRQVVKAK